MNCMASATVYEILDDLWYAATSEADKGSKFERLMAAYLRTDPTFADQFSDVWLWQEWPGRDGKHDTGIDLVAKDRVSGNLVAVQCKFYDPTGTIAKPDVDSFLAASGKAGFAERIIVSTTERWNANAEDAIRDQQIPVRRIGLSDLENSLVDWAQFSFDTPDLLPLHGRKQLRAHQVTAIEQVLAGFESSERGKLIMACGTGKTFTSLRLAEQVAGKGGSVLFLVPSISLLSQSLKEWATEAELPLSPFAVCSDTKVGKQSEDISSVDLALPATTNPAVLHDRLTTAAQDPDRLRVVFATYQSIDVVAQAQRQGGVDPFDLIICDEAHRTTGATLAGEDESAFVRVHDLAYILGDRRLYMTATPRIYDDNAKAKAGEANAVLASMDDEDVFGPEFHRLGFGEAVSQGLLSDYKVLVLAVDEGHVATTFQHQFADDNHELGLGDVAKIVGCWNGLAKRGLTEHDFDTDPEPMRRAVAFASRIEDSKKIERLFADLVDHYIDAQDLDDNPDDDAAGVLRCEVRHVDGTFNALERNQRIDWLKGTTEGTTCRILTNARCLSEGVDVPALDAVMFLNPRKSVVDVVQSVGRVMRKSPGKKYGYIILPIGIPADMDPAEALRDNTRYAVVWEVLQALRAHDERFDAMVNKIELNKARDAQVNVIGVAGRDSDGPRAVQDTLPIVFPNLEDWRNAIYARIVTKVGTRRYWEDWAKDVHLIAERHTTRITALLDNPEAGLQGTFADFLGGLRATLNDSITAEQAVSMLSQHLITKPVFDALFEGYAFTEHNPVSKVMQGMIDALATQHLETETEKLDRFYESVRVRAAGIDNAEGKQRIITELYEKFFRLAFPKAAESLGIVYTPVEVVDFILRSVEHVLNTQFAASLTDHGVHVLDPFTGTGTFIVRLLESGFIRPGDLARKYTTELHANEILLLAYYIAAINIEATYHGLLTQTDPEAGYEPFTGIVLTDTFQMTEHGDTLDATVFPTNSARAEAQKALDIRVIIGNPPYSVGQTSGNDANANLKYPTLDANIETTYAARSTATNKNSLYDSYIRAIRWATDRIGDDGVIGYVTNGGWIDSNTADGLRQTLAEEFAAIHVYNLRGNARTAGEQRRKEKDNVFGQGARTTVAIVLLVKKPHHTGQATIHYRDIGDYLTREDKLHTLTQSALTGDGWQQITPNEHGDWLSQRNHTFAALTPLGTRDRAEVHSIFNAFSRGLETGRDAWIYNYSIKKLTENIRRTIAAYNGQVDAFVHLTRGLPERDRQSHVEGSIDPDPAKISWTRSLKASLRKYERATFQPTHVASGLYRPFCRQHVYYDAQLNHERSQQPRFFPSPSVDNIGIELTGPASHYEFCCIATDRLPDLHLLDTGQFFPRWTYETNSDDDLLSGLSDDHSGYQRLDNITDTALTEYRTAYGPDVTNDDIFYYVYGMLHSPDYRERYAADLKRSLPRIPLVATGEDFHAFRDAGRELATLHIGYEAVEPYPLQESAPMDLDEWNLYRVTKMRYGGKGTAKDKSTVVYNSHVTLTGIPDEAHRYLLGSRTALEWVMERYQVKTDKPSGIVNDPNDWAREVGDPRYIVDLVKRVVTVSVETMRIVDGLPPLEIVGDTAP